MMSADAEGSKVNRARILAVIDHDSIESRPKTPKFDLWHQTGLIILGETPCRIE